MCRMYHGTRPEVAALIEQGGFKASTHGLLGPGVYLSRDADKARKYGATVLEVLVRMGRVCRVDHHPELIPKGNGTDAPWHHVGGFDAAWVPPDCAAGIFENAKHFSGVVEEDCVWDSGRVKVLGRTVDDGDERMGLVEWCFEDGAEDGKMNMGSRWIVFSRAEAMVIESHYRAWMRGEGDGRAVLAGDGPRNVFGLPCGNRRTVYFDEMVERSVPTGVERRVIRSISQLGGVTRLQAAARCAAERRRMARLVPALMMLQRTCRGHLCRQRVRLCACGA